MFKIFEVKFGGGYVRNEYIGEFIEVVTEALGAFFAFADFL